MNNLRSAWTDSSGNRRKDSVLLLSISVNQYIDLSEGLLLTQVTVNQLTASLLASWCYITFRVGV